MVVVIYGEFVKGEIYMVMFDEENCSVIVKNYMVMYLLY